RTRRAIGGTHAAIDPGQRGCHVRLLRSGRVGGARQTRGRGLKQIARCVDLVARVRCAGVVSSEVSEIAQAIVVEIRRCEAESVDSSVRGQIQKCVERIARQSRYTPVTEERTAKVPIARAAQ